MEYKLASDFKTKVKGLLKATEYDGLLDILNSFLTDSKEDLQKLVQSLHKLVDNPDKLILYDHVRFLIPLKRQQDYSRLVPKSLRTTVKLVRIDRRLQDSLGFSIRGGFEHGIGIYVSAVSQSSAAAQTGLKVGDEILFINGFTLEHAIHDDAVSLVKAAAGEVTLRVRSIGMVPHKDQSTNAVKWTKVEGWENFENARGPHERRGRETVTVAIRVPPGGALGCSIRAGKEEHENSSGIYVEIVKPESLAAQAGLEPADEIVEANGIMLAGLSTQEVIKALKFQADVELIIRKAKGKALPDSEVTNGTRNDIITTAIIENATSQMKLDNATASEISADGSTEEEPEDMTYL